MSLLFPLCHFGFHRICNFIVNQNPPAIFAYNYFFMHPDVELVLRGDFIKTATTSITLYLDYCKAISGILPDPVVGCDKALLYHGVELLRIFYHRFLFFLPLQ